MEVALEENRIEGKSLLLYFTDALKHQYVQNLPVTDAETLW